MFGFHAEEEHLEPLDPVWGGVQSRTPTIELFPAAADRAASSLPGNKVYINQSTCWEHLRTVVLPFPLSHQNPFLRRSVMFTQYGYCLLSSHDRSSTSCFPAGRTLILSASPAWTLSHPSDPTLTLELFCNTKLLRSSPQQPQAELFSSSQTALAKLLDPADHMQP